MIKVTAWKTKFNLNKEDVLNRDDVKKANIAFKSSGIKRKRPVKLAKLKFMEKEGEEPKSA